MEIQEKTSSNNSELSFKDYFLSRKKTIPIILYSISLIIVGIYIHKFGIARSVFDFIKTTSEHGTRNILAKISANPLRLNIDINHKDYQQIAFNRDQSLKQGMRIPEAEDYVNAKLTLRGGLAKKVKMRLKGVHTDHWLDPLKWSLRVKTKKGKLLGMKHFALLNPRTRDYINEWVYLQALKREGLIALRMNFVDLTLNGKHHGVYALEEHYGNELLDNNKRPRGPIVSFKKDLLEKELYRFKRQDRQAIKKNALLERSMIGGASLFESSPVVANQMKKIKESPADFRVFEKAASLLENFRARKLKASEVFDPDKIGMFLALRALCGALSTDQNDTKFYYNPITAKLEAIGAELHYGKRVGKWWVNDKHDIKKPFLDLFFDDPIVFKAYLKALNKVSEPAYLKAFFEDINDPLKENLNILYTNYPDYEFDQDDYFKNQSYIRNMLNPVKGLHAYFFDFSPSFLILELGNIQAMPIEVLSLSLKGGKVLEINKPTVLEAKKTMDLVTYKKLKFKLGAIEIPKADLERIAFLDDLKINYKVPEVGKVQSAKVFSWRRTEES